MVNSVSEFLDKKDLVDFKCRVVNRAFSKLDDIEVLKMFWNTVFDNFERYEKDLARLFCEGLNLDVDLENSTFEERWEKIGHELGNYFEENPEELRKLERQAEELRGEMEDLNYVY